MKKGRKAPTSTRPTKKSRVAPPFVKAVRTFKEMMYFDGDKDATAIPNIGGASWAGTELDPTANCLFSPVQGDDFNNRHGRKVYVKKIKIRGLINVAAEANQAAADGGNLYRIIMYMDQQTNAAQSQGEDLMASGSATLNNINCFQNPANFGRFRVLKDKVWTLAAPTLTFDGTNIEQSGLVRAFKFTHVFKEPLLIHFNATNGGTVADIIDNSFHIIGACGAAALPATLSYKSRVSFFE